MSLPPLDCGHTANWVLLPSGSRMCAECLSITPLIETDKLKVLPSLGSDEVAERFVDSVDLAEYDPSGFKVMHPVDILKECGVQMTPEVEAQLRAHCDAPAELVTEDPKQRIVRMSTERGDFVQADDGYYVYWPKGYPGGYVGAAELRILADHLDSMNAEWDAQVKRDLGAADHQSGAQHE